MTSSVSTAISPSTGIIYNICSKKDTNACKNQLADKIAKGKINYQIHQIVILRKEIEPHFTNMILQTKI